MIFQTVSHTPRWVFVLFGVLLIPGFRLSRPHRAPIYALFAMPAAMVGLSLYAIWSSFGSHGPAVLAWVAGLGIAASCAVVLWRSGIVTYSSASRCYTVPGSWLPLSLMMMIFFARYAVAASMAVHASLLESSVFALAAGLVYGRSSGALLARGLHAWRSAVRDPAVPGAAGVATCDS